MRTTSDKKDNVLRIRINEDMNKYLIKASIAKDVSISQYIRDLIKRDMTIKKF